MTNLSVIIPAFNEESRLGPSLSRIREYFAAAGIKYEIIVVDDGSADGTASVASGFDSDCVKTISNTINRGKGFSVRRGVMEASGEMILFSDADLSTPIEEFEKLKIAMERTGADVAAGSRALAASEIVRRQPFYRELMGKVFNKIARLLTFGGIKDSQCGFKLFRREAAKTLFGAAVIDGFAFDAEIIFLAQKKGLKVAEVPVKWFDNPNTRVNAVSDSARMLAELIKIRLNYISGKYK